MKGRFLRRGTVTRGMRAELADDLAQLGRPIAANERACCCPARPMVTVMMPPTASRPHPIQPTAVRPPLPGQPGRAAGRRRDCLRSEPSPSRTVQLSELEEMGVAASPRERRSSAFGCYAARLQGLWFRALAQYRRLQHPAGELVKITFLIYMAAWISKNQTRSKSFMEGLVPFLTLLAGVLIPLILQPSTTTAVLIRQRRSRCISRRARRSIFLSLDRHHRRLRGGFPAFITPYRMQRVLGFLNRIRCRRLSINQSLMAIGSGGLTGVGYGHSTTKLNYLPEPIGDSIFAVIGEELGFIGSIALIFFFLLFIWRGLIIARAAPDLFGRLLGNRVHDDHRFSDVHPYRPIPALYPSRASRCRSSATAGRRSRSF